MKRPTVARLIRLAKAAAAVAVLAGLYARLDFDRVALALREVEGVPLSAALALFAPLTLLSALRWRDWIAPVSQISLRESAAQILSCNALNLALPSKLGDVAKAGMLPGVDAATAARATWRAGLEKASDLASLLLVLLWGVGGRLDWPQLGCGMALSAAAALLAARRSASRGPHQNARAGIWRAGQLLSMSLLLWQVHLLQLHLLVCAAGAGVTLSESAARVPLAVLAGLLPIAFCGVGPRDAALVWLFSDIAPAPQMAAAGLLSALRYVVPGILGLPFLLRVRIAAAPGHKANRLDKPDVGNGTSRLANTRTVPTTAQTCVVNAE